MPRECHCNGRLKAFFQGNKWPPLQPTPLFLADRRRNTSLYPCRTCASHLLVFVGLGNVCGCAKWCVYVYVYIFLSNPNLITPSCGSGGPFLLAGFRRISKSMGKLGTSCGNSYYCWRRTSSSILCVPNLLSQVQPSVTALLSF